MLEMELMAMLCNLMQLMPPALAIGGMKRRSTAPIVTGSGAFLAGRTRKHGLDFFQPHLSPLSCKTLLRVIAIYPLSRRIEMAPLTQRTSATAVKSDNDDVKPNNPLQSDFASGSDDGDSMDSDERYLVRLCGSRKHVHG